MRRLTWLSDRMPRPILLFLLFTSAKACFEAVAEDDVALALLWFCVVLVYIDWLWRRWRS